jgi:2'-5' RNA ligase
MPFAIVLFFNKSQSAPIDAIIKELADTKIAPFMFENSTPHITLAIYDLFDCINNKGKLKEFTLSYKIDSVDFSHLGLFSSKRHGIFIAPIVTTELLQYHQQFHNYFKNDAVGSWEFYLPRNWIPHCTLGFDVHEDKVEQAFSICRKLKLPLEIGISSIGIMEFEPVKEVYRIATTNTSKIN